jgi:hypothetical protein
MARFWRLLSVLLWKNWLLKKRHPLSTILEVRHQCFRWAHRAVMQDQWCIKVYQGALMHMCADECATGGQSCGTLKGAIDLESGLVISCTETPASV